MCVQRSDFRGRQSDERGEPQNKVDHFCRGKNVLFFKIFSEILRLNGGVLIAGCSIKRCSRLINAASRPTKRSNRPINAASRSTKRSTARKTCRAIPSKTLQPLDKRTEPPDKALQPLDNSQTNACAEGLTSIVFIKSSTVSGPT